MGKNLKASDHRLTSGNNQNRLSQQAVSKFTDESFSSIFSIALDVSLINISNDPCVTSPDISDLCNFVSESSATFQQLFVNSTCNITQSSDREQLFRNLHHI